MINVKKIILFVSVSFSCISSVIAKCYFGINLGDEYPEKFYDTAGPLNKVTEQDAGPEYKKINKEIEYLRFAYFDASELCNDSTLKDIQIEFAFLQGKLAAIKMIAMNDEKNIPTKKLTLMNYAKKNYGDFDTGTNQQNYNNFHYWEKINSLVIYKRLIGEQNIWDEEIYISNKVYNEALQMALSGEDDINNIRE